MYVWYGMDVWCVVRGVSVCLSRLQSKLAAKSLVLGLVALAVKNVVGDPARSTRGGNWNSVRTNPFLLRERMLPDAGSPRTRK